jgi:hypothetical protein
MCQAMLSRNSSPLYRLRHTQQGHLWVLLGIL